MNADSEKSVVPSEFRSLFKEDERRVRKDQDGEQIFSYVSTRDAVLSRILLIGFDSDDFEEAFNRWRKDEIRNLRYLESEIDEFDDRKVSLLKDFTFEEWCERVPGVLLERYESDDSGEVFVHDKVDGYMKDPRDSWLFFGGHGSILSLGSLLYACDDVESVVLDFTDLVYGGWIDDNEKLCEKSIGPINYRGESPGPTVVMAEGKSDIRMLKHGLYKCFPELSDQFVFFEHDEFKVDGGASQLVAFLKAFAAARVPINVVAVFDNDTAGHVSYDAACAINLPDNLLPILMPDISIAKNYPTEGPTGAEESDVNGLACGIEMYLGRSSLTRDGNLIPIRWTGYNKKAAKYQGEISDKKFVQSKFLKGKDDDAEEMTQLWMKIIRSASLVTRKMQRVAPEAKSLW